MGAVSHPDEARRQLDLFLDGADAMLVNEIAAALVAGRGADAERALGQLRKRNPRHPDLRAFGLVCRAQRAEASSTPTHPAAMMALIEDLEGSLAPAADRLLGPRAGAALRPVWARLVDAAAALPLAECRPAAPLYHWLGVAHYRLGDERQAFRWWLALCWLDPEGFPRYGPRLPSSMMREEWAEFEREPEVANPAGGAVSRARWFPSWLLLRHRGFGRLFGPTEIPDAGVATRVFGLLLALLPFDGAGHSAELVQHRSALRALDPAFFRLYMRAVSGRTGAGPRVRRLS